MRFLINGECNVCSDNREFYAEINAQKHVLEDGKTVLCFRCLKGIYVKSLGYFTVLGRRKGKWNEA